MGGEEREREGERQKKKKRDDKRRNQCGRFASLYADHHAKLMERRRGEGKELGADVITQSCV